MSDVTIRTATSDDADEVTRLLAEMKRHHRELDPGSARFHVPLETLATSVRHGLSDPSVVVIVADAGGHLAGFAKLRFVERSWGRACEVESLMVEEGRRGQGVGTRLMDAAEERASAAGAAAMRLDVSLFNEAAAEFYGRRGYERIAVRLGKPLSE